jgi:hypothetical protein
MTPELLLPSLEEVRPVLHDESYVKAVAMVSVKKSDGADVVVKVLKSRFHTTN